MFENQIYPITFMQIQIFLTLGECKNFLKTAEILHMTQPGVSKSLGKLEYILGFQLFLRTSRKVEFTEAGEQLFKRWKPAMEQLIDAYDQEMLKLQTELQTIRIGIAEETDSSKYFWDIATQFKQENPYIRLQVEGDRLNHLLPALKRELYDVVFIPDFEYCDSEENAEFCRGYAAKSNMRAIVSVDNPLATCESVLFSDLSDYEIVAPAPSYTSSYIHFLENKFAEYGKKPSIGYYSKSNFQTKYAIRANSKLIYVADAFWDFHEYPNSYKELIIRDQQNGILYVWNPKRSRPLTKDFLKKFPSDL